MRTTRRWQVWVSLVAGAWLFVSPWVLGYTAATAGMWAAYVLGALAILIAFWAVSAREPRNGVALLALVGALTFVTPWVIGFAGHYAARLDAWIVGAVMVVAALWGWLESYGRRDVQRPRPMA